MKVAIIGSGHGGCAMAAVLSMQGHDVSLVKLGDVMHTDNFRILKKRKTIRLKGIEGEGEFPLRCVTHRPGEAVPDAELVLIYYVSNYHDFVARQCADYFHQGQTVVLNPGYCGSLLMLRRMKAIGNDAVPLFAEFETLPYSCRLDADGAVTIVSRNVRHPFALFPQNRSDEFIARFGSVFGECVPRSHLLEVALHNPNLVIHTVGVLLNVSMIENQRLRFAMYRDGFSKSVWNVVQRLDAEKMTVLERMGFAPVPYFDEFKLRTFVDTAIDGFAGFNRYAAEAPDGPFTVNHRYLTEDVPIGLGLLHSLGRHLGVETPMCDSLIHMADALLPNVNFWENLRTLESIWNGSLEDLLAFEGSSDASFCFASRQ